MGIHGCSYQNKERDAQNFRAFSRVQPVADVLRCAVEEVASPLSRSITCY